ncbi:hypothetical protein [Aquimarina agarivorans]|uniref:hypothetical protein n=1 Tax=Aquimarina agarivorans TaxID=980584 RepID=UPI000248E985|nr:hypothetical protein [Aquimarina agarivorans]
MNKLFSTLLSFLLLLTISSCSSDDAGTPITPEIDLVDENLVGDWNLVDFEVTNGTAEIAGFTVNFTVEGSEFDTTALFATNPNTVNFEGTFKATTNFTAPAGIPLPDSIQTQREDTFESEKILGETSEINNWSINDGNTVIAGSQAKIIKFTADEVQYELDIDQTDFVTIIEEGFDLNGFTATNPKGQIVVTLERK